MARSVKVGAKPFSVVADASCPLAGYVLAMSNAFGFVLDDASLRRAAVEGVPETVIAAIYLLHERSVGEVAAKLTPDELEHVIRLVGRCPSCYPPGTLDALKSKRMASLTSTVGSLLPSAATNEDAAAHQHPNANGHLRAQRPRKAPQISLSGQMQHRSQPAFAGPPARETSGEAAKSGTLTGTAAETARRRLIVEDLVKAGLSIRMIAGATDISRSAVHRAKMAIAKAEAKKELAAIEIASELLGHKLSHRRRRRA